MCEHFFRERGKVCAHSVYFACLVGIQRRKVCEKRLGGQNVLGIYNYNHLKNAVLEILKHPAYDPEQMELDKEYVAKKMGITVEEFDEIIAQPNKTPADYKNQMWIIRLGVFFSKLLGLENRNLRI